MMLVKRAEVYGYLFPQPTSNATVELLVSRAGTEGRSWRRAFLPCENDVFRVDTTNLCQAGYGCCGYGFELRDTQMV
jgi:hypothetical protein